MIEHMIAAARNLEPSRDISPDDQMYRPDAEGHYYAVGRSALRLVWAAALARLEYSGGDAPITKILDFGCGHGRVARWLRAAYPTADIAVTDYDARGAAWCAEHFGCRPIGGDLPADAFDLIWLGSVFTHLPEAASRDLLRSLWSALRPNGVLLFTSQGRYPCSAAMAGLVRPDYNIGRKAMLAVAAGFRARGYGYVDYPGQSNYGVTMIDAAWFRDQMIGPDCIQILFQEKGLDNHQDVLGFMRAALHDERKGAF